MSSPIRLLLVGCGDIARSGHLPAIARSPEFELVGAVDVDDDHRIAVARAYDVPAWARMDEAGASRPEAVIIAVPPQHAPGLTVEAIDLGLDVLCEKPMGVDVPSAERVHRRALASDRVVQIGLKNRFSPLVRALRTWIDDGLLGAGPLVYTLGYFDEAHDPEDDVHTGRIRNFLSRGASFVHEGSHYADYLAFLGAGAPVSIEAVGLRSRDDLPAENFVAATVRFDTGSVARVEVGWQFPWSPPGDFRILGSEGVAILDRPAQTLTLVRRAESGGLERTVVREDRPWNDECFDRQLAEFARAIRTRSRPEVSTAEGLAALRFSLAVAASARRGDSGSDESGSR